MNFVGPETDAVVVSLGTIIKVFVFAMEEGSVKHTSENLSKSSS